MRYVLLVLFFVTVASSLKADTFPIKIKLQDDGGAALKDELVIVQDLKNGEQELLRALSDQGGNVPTLQLPPGLYRVIATAPYGLWETNIREFLVGQRATEIVVMVQPMALHGYGDIIVIGIAHAQLRVIGPSGEPASGAQILIRDRDATLYLERWYKTDDRGNATIELVGKPTVAVVIYDGVHLTTELDPNNLKPVIRLQKQ
jgi:hypothetical protein